MARSKFDIEVTEATAGDQRTFTVTISAAAKDFMLADLLSERGKIKGLEVLLKEAARETAEGYLTTAENLIAGIGAGQKEQASTQKSEAPVRKSKLNGSGKEARKGAQHVETPAKFEPVSHPMTPAVSGD
jgi:hypothetical protein